MPLCVMGQLWGYCHFDRYNERREFQGKGNSEWPARGVESTQVYTWHFWMVAESAQCVSAENHTHYGFYTTSSSVVNTTENKHITKIHSWPLWWSRVSIFYLYIESTVGPKQHSLHVGGCVCGWREHWCISFPPLVPGVSAAEQVYC